MAGQSIYGHGLVGFEVGLELELEKLKKRETLECE